MKQHSFESHSPEAMCHLSNLGHIVEGALFGIVGLLALLGNLGGFTWVSSAWRWSSSSLGSCCCSCFMRFTPDPTGQ